MNNNKSRSIIKDVTIEHVCLPQRHLNSNSRLFDLLLFTFLPMTSTNLYILFWLGGFGEYSQLLLCDSIATGTNFQFKWKQEILPKSNQIKSNIKGAYKTRTDFSDLSKKVCGIWIFLFSY